MNIPSNIELTESQGALMPKLGAFLGPDGSASCFVLKGYAGTGKTFMMKHIIEELRGAGRNVVLMAPTGRAAKVLARATGCQASTIHRTIYSLDKLIEYKTIGEDGTETFKFFYALAENRHQSNTVYIVDEASMVSDVYSEAEFFRFGSGHLLTDLFQFLKMHECGGSRVLFVGDPAQLPPVNSSTSPALDMAHLVSRGLSCCEHELTDVVRQRAESGILVNATMLRGCIHDKRYHALHLDTSLPDMSQLDDARFIDRYIAICPDRPGRNCIVLSHTNAMANTLNRAIRAHYFPGEKNIAPGDSAIIIANNYSGSVPLFNGDFTDVASVAAESEVVSVPLNRPTKDGKKNIIHVTLRFRDVTLLVDQPDQEEPALIACKIVENALDSNEPNLTSDEVHALYAWFKQRNPGLNAKDPMFKKIIRTDPYFNAIQVKYGYAITCHKAQGGEWPYVLADFDASMKHSTEYYFRWAYTAVTRAQSHLAAINPPSFNTALTAEQEGWIAYNAVDTAKIVTPDLTAQHPDLPADPMLIGIYQTVLGLVCRHDIAIKGISHHPYCEHYVLARGNTECRFKIHYNKKRTVSSILVEPSSDAAFATEIEATLQQVIGTRILCSEPETLIHAAPAPGVAIPSYIAEHRAAVEARCGDEIHIVEFILRSIHHATYRFRSGQDEATVDCYFDQHGRFTRPVIASKSVSNRALLDGVHSLVLGKDTVTPQELSAAPTPRPNLTGPESHPAWRVFA